MEKELFYKGRRLSKSDALVYAYEDADGKTCLFKKLIKPSALGGSIWVVTNDGEKFTFKSYGEGSGDIELVRKWSIEDRDHRLWKEQIANVGKERDGHVNILIEAVKKSTSSYVQRRRLALYIYEQLLK